MTTSTLLRHSKLVLGVFMFTVKALQGCSSTLPSASAPSSSDQPGALEVIPVRGTIVETHGATVGRLHGFRSPLPVAGAHAELYVAGFPTEEFDAEVTDVTRLDEGWYAAGVQLLQADARLAPGTVFEGRLVVRPLEPIACREATP
jgi:hypothetical protein